MAVLKAVRFLFNGQDFVCENSFIELADFPGRYLRTFMIY